MNKTVIYTLGSFGMRDFVENWLIGIKKARSHSILTDHAFSVLDATCVRFLSRRHHRPAARFFPLHTSEPPDLLTIHTARCFGRPSASWASPTSSWERWTSPLRSTWRRACCDGSIWPFFRRPSWRCPLR